MSNAANKTTVALVLDEPIPFYLTPKAQQLLRAYRVTRFLRIRRPRHWRN
jgi:hypothetical protein